MFQTDLLNKLQMIHYTENEDMRTHLGAMKAIHKCLAKTGSQITGDSFNTHIHTSLSLTTRFQPVFNTFDTTTHQRNMKISSADLIWHITEEVNNAMMEESINQLNATMAAAHTKLPEVLVAKVQEGEVTGEALFF